MRFLLLGLTALPLVASWQVLPGQRVVFKGDSIAKGYAFGNYDDLSPLRTLAGQARILAQSRFADPPDFLVAPTIWKGLHSDGTAVTVDTLSEEVRANVSRGDIRIGDWLIYEDAGELDKFIQPAPWPNPRNIYALYRESLREMILELEGAVSRSRILLMTMFDYEPRCRWCRWDEPLDATGKTGNDIIRDTGAELGVAVVGFLCPIVTARGIQVIQFDQNGSRWAPSAAGEPFFTEPREFEPSLADMGGFYYLYTRGQVARRHLHRSSDGFRFRLIVERCNHTTPQVLNQGLDGRLYLTTNTGPGWLRNPLVAYALRGLTFTEPIAIHDEKGISHDRGREVPFLDHGIAVNVHLDGRWRHLLLYRVCDLRETNGRGAPRTPQTGLYLAELTYTATKRPPWRLAE